MHGRRRLLVRRRRPDRRRGSEFAGPRDRSSRPGGGALLERQPRLGGPLGAGGVGVDSGPARVGGRPRRLEELGGSGGGARRRGSRHRRRPSPLLVRAGDRPPHAGRGRGGGGAGTVRRLVARRLFGGGCRAVAPGPVVGRGGGGGGGPGCFRRRWGRRGGRGQYRGRGRGRGFRAGQRRRGLACAGRGRASGVVAGGGRVDGAGGGPDDGRGGGCGGCVAPARLGERCGSAKPGVELGDRRLVERGRHRQGVGGAGGVASGRRRGGHAGRGSGRADHGRAGRRGALGPGMALPTGAGGRGGCRSCHEARLDAHDPGHGGQGRRACTMGSAGRAGLGRRRTAARRHGGGRRPRVRNCRAGLAGGPKRRSRAGRIRADGACPGAQRQSRPERRRAALPRPVRVLRRDDRGPSVARVGGHSPRAGPSPGLGHIGRPSCGPIPRQRPSPGRGLLPGRRPSRRRSSDPSQGPVPTGRVDVAVRRPRRPGANEVGPDSRLQRRA